MFHQLFYLEKRYAWNVPFTWNAEQQSACDKKKKEAFNVGQMIRESNLTSRTQGLKSDSLLGDLGFAFYQLCGLERVI